MTPVLSIFILMIVSDAIGDSGTYKQGPMAAEKS